MNSQQDLFYDSPKVDGSLDDCLESYSHIVRYVDYSKSLHYYYLDPAYVDMSKCLHVCSSNQLVELALIWPFDLYAPSISSILLNRALHHHSQGKEQINCCIYPFTIKENELLSEIRFDRKLILSEVNDAMNSCLTEGGGVFSEHHSDLACIKEINEDDKSSFIPLGSIMGVFNWDKDSWKTTTENYFKELRISLNNHPNKTPSVKTRKKQLLKHAREREKNFDGYTALFRIIRTYSPSDAKKILLKNFKLFDVFVVDARKVMLSRHRNWVSDIVSLLDLFDKDARLPSVVVLTEDIETFSRLKARVYKYRNNDSKKRFQQSYWYKPRRRSYSVVSGRDELPGYVKIEARAIGGKLMQPLAELEKLATAESSNNLRGNIYKTINFLVRLLNTPLAQSVINEHLLTMLHSDRAEREAKHLASFVLWRQFRSSLNDEAFKNNYTHSPIFVQMLGIADELVEKIASCSPLVSHLRQILSSVSATKVLIVLDKHCLNLEKWIEAFYENDFVSLDIQVTRTVDANQLSHWAEHIIYAGADDEALKSLITLPACDAKLTFLTSGYTALRFERHLNMIHQESAFRPIHKRVSQLLEDLAPQIATIKQTYKEIKLPDDFVFSGGPPGNFTPSEDHDYHYADIMLEDYGHLTAGKMSRLIRLTKKDDVPFEIVNVDQLRVGDLLCVTDDIDLHDLMERATSHRSVGACQVLNQYFKTAREAIMSRYRQPTKKATAEAVLHKMQKNNSAVAESVRLPSLINWIENIMHSDQISSEDIKTVSPRDIEVFILFAGALGIFEANARQIWQLGIKNYRSAKTIEGRAFYQNLKHVLTSHYIDGAQREGLGESDHDLLILMAKQATYPVKKIDILEAEDE